MSGNVVFGIRNGFMLGALLVFGFLFAATLQAREIKPSALKQIAQLQAEKATRTPAQQKMDSRLLYTLKDQRGEIARKNLPRLRNNVAVAKDGTVLVDIRASVSDELLRQIHDLGGSVIHHHRAFDAIRAYLPLNALEIFAADTAVRAIRPADQMMTHSLNMPLGQVVTEGDIAHGADTVRTNFGVDGTGVMVCAMSDSVDELATLQGLGELPSVTVLTGQDGNPGSSEGTALLEIIHDMAPGAALGFATGKGGQAQMAQNILDLAAAGCNVIVDDVFYFAEAVFQDGVIAQAVDEVAAAGVLYFSSAGNSGNFNDGTSGVHEADYSGTTLPTVLNGLGMSAHNFNGTSVTNEVTEDALNPTPFFTLSWADPLGASSNDYDLFLLNAAADMVVAMSNATQNGGQDAFEIIDSIAPDDTGNHLVVVKVNGDDRFFHMNTHRGRLEFGTDGQLAGHAGAEGAVAVAATFVGNAGGAPFTGGPGNPVETFSSDGPRRIFFDADGDPVSLTRGVSSVVRQKPDVTAADGVSTASTNFPTFFGTSASAPHAAAISALYIEIFPSISALGIADILKSTALDIEAPGFDRDSGNGIIMTEEPINNTIFADGFESGDATAWTK